MERVKNEKLHNYKDRWFNIKTLEKNDGFYVVIEDVKTKQQMRLTGKCTYETYFDILKSGKGKSDYNSEASVQSIKNLRINDDGLHVSIEDPETSGDAVEDIIILLKRTLNEWVDKRLA